MTSVFMSAVVAFEWRQADVSISISKNGLCALDWRGQHSLGGCGCFYIGLRSGNQ